MAIPFKSIGRRIRSWFTANQQPPVRKQNKRCRPLLEVLEDRSLPSVNPAIGDVFYIALENHNFTQPASDTSAPQQLFGNPAAPYINSLITPGNPNAAQVSYATAYHNVLATPSGNNPHIHPSEPNYIWDEAGNNFGVAGDPDPYSVGTSNVFGPDKPNLSGLLQNAGISWKSYQEGIDMTANTYGYYFTVSAPSTVTITSGAVYSNNGQSFTVLSSVSGGTSFTTTGTGAPVSSGTLTLVSGTGPATISYATVGTGVNFPAPNSLTSTVAPSNQWTVPTSSFSGTSASYTNPYNGSHQYNYAVKHDGQLFFTDTNGGTLTAPNPSPSNPETAHYDPLQQLATDLANNTVGRYNWITPDQYNDMHTALTGGFTYNGIHYTGDAANISQGDNFLSILIPQIMASQAYKNNGMIVIWNDETEGANADDFSHTSTEIVISPLAKGNAYDSTLNYTHSSDLKTLQELFGVPAPGGGFLGDANTPGTNDLSDMLVPGPGATLQGNTLYLVGGSTSDHLSITPIGGSQNGSTGISVTGQLNGVNIINRTFTGVTSIDVVGFGGNDQVLIAGSLTIPTVIRADNGNDLVALGNGNSTVDLGNGNDQVLQGGGSTQGGNGNNIINAGNGNDLVTLGNGSNTVTIMGNGNDLVTLGNGSNTVTIMGNGNDHVQLGSGYYDSVTIVGNGNDLVALGNGYYDSATIVGNGNDLVTLGNGYYDSATIMGNGNDLALLGNGNYDSVTIAGNGNDLVLVGNGLYDFVLMVGNGTDIVLTGNGSGQAHISGSGIMIVHLGHGWTQI